MDGMTFSRAVRILFRGIGQVMFQRSAFTGLLFLTGIALNSPVSAAGLVLGAGTGLLTATLLGYPPEEISDGLYGFNGGLTALAVFSLFEITPASVSAAVLGSAVSTVITGGMMRQNTAPFTFPFVITTWLIVFTLRLLQAAPERFSPTASDAFLPPVIRAPVTSFSQVMFQPTVLSGLIFFLAILVHSRPAALIALSGSLLSLLIASLFRLSSAVLSDGLYGYNGILCALAYTGRLFRGAVPAAAAVLLSVLLVEGMRQTGFPALTAPFVISVWAVNALEKGTERRFR